MEKIITPFSHTAAVKSPPHYVDEVKYTDIYPHIFTPTYDKPKGKYSIKDEHSQTIEKGKAKPIIHMYPTP